MNNQWLPPFPYRAPDTFGGMNVMVRDAQQQQRTPRDVRGPWVRPKVPNKTVGRWGTRRMWKRRNPPHHVMLYREPTDALRIYDTLILTPLQWDAIRRQTVQR